MAFPKITFLDKVYGSGVPKEQNLITPDNINEIKHVVNSLSEALDNIISGLGSGGIQEIYYINDIEFPVSGINGSLYINNIGQTKYYINDSYIDLSLPVLTDFNTTEQINNKTVATTLAISSFIDSKIQNFITADDIPKYKAGDMIDITDDNTINVILPKNNLEISGRYLVCHRDIS